MINHPTKAKAPGAINTEGLGTDTTNDLNFPTSERQHKVFSTLVAGFALKGHTLQRTESKDGAVTYFATRWGLVRYLPTLEAAQRFYAQIGGTP